MVRWRWPWRRFPPPAALLEMTCRARIGWDDEFERNRGYGFRYPIPFDLDEIRDLVGTPDQINPFRIYRPVMTCCPRCYGIRKEQPGTELPCRECGGYGEIYGIYISDSPAG